jgi:hypothetical protein
MIFDVVTDDNFELYAAKHYDNPNCTAVSEFYDDLKHIHYIKRLITRYRSTGTLKTKLLLNHIIVFYNLFGTEAATKMLFFRINEESYPVLKPFLLYLSYMPDKIVGIKHKDWSINNSDIALDTNVVKHLRQL